MIKKAIIAILFATTAMADGNVTLTYGPMFAGKTKKLIEDVENFQKNPLHIPITISYAKNSRDGERTIKSRAIINRLITTTTSFGSGKMSLQEHYIALLKEKFKQPISDFDSWIQAASEKGYKIDIFIDEFQFLNIEEIHELKEFMNKFHVGIHFYGLKLDFKKETFEAFTSITELFSPKIEQLFATCQKCKTPDAEFTGRFTEDGKFIASGEQIVIEKSTTDSYFPICSVCWGNNIS